MEASQGARSSDASHGRDRDAISRYWTTQRQARVFPAGIPCMVGIEMPLPGIVRDLTEVCHQQKGVTVHLPAVWKNR